MRLIIALAALCSLSGCVTTADYLGKQINCENAAIVRDAIDAACPIP